MGGLGIGTEREDVLFVEMGITHIGVARYDRTEHPIGVGLAQHLERGLGIDRWVAHSKQEAEQREFRIEVPPHFADCLRYLNDTIKLKISRRNNNNDII